MGFKTVFSIIAWTMVFVSTPLLGHGAADPLSITLNAYCPMLESGMRNYDEDSQAYRSMATDHRTHCRPTDGEVSYFKTLRELGITQQNEYLDRPREVVETREASAKAQEAITEAGEDRERLMHQCKMQCGEMLNACRGKLANVEAKANSEFNRIMGLTNGNEASVNQACNSVSSFRSTAQSLINEASSDCDSYTRTCVDTCNKAETRAQQVMGPFPNQRPEGSDWMAANKAVGDQTKQMLPALVREKNESFNNKSQSLENACNNAKQALQQKKDEQKQAKDDKKKNDSTNQALGNALQSLGSALAQQPTTLPPLGTDMGVQSGYMPAQQYTDSGVSGLSTATKGSGVPGGAVNPGGDPLLLGDDLGGPPGAQPGKTSRMGQQNGGGGGAGVGSGGGGSAANAKNARRGGARSRFDTDVLRGAQGGAGSAGGARGGNGYPDEMNGRGAGGARARAQAALNQQRMVSLQKFLPGRMPVPQQRNVANTVGPDGITGPHTDLFKKVRIRYNDTVLDNGF